MSGLHRTGARFVLERRALHATGADYLVRIEHPGLQPLTGDVAIGAGDVPPTDVVWHGLAPNPDEARFVSGLARSIQSGARRQEGWPRRVARWRNGEAPDEA